VVVKEVMIVEEEVEKVGAVVLVGIGLVTGFSERQTQIIHNIFTNRPTHLSTVIAILISTAR